MAQRDTAKSNGNSKGLSIAEQENSIHAGIAPRPDPTTAILRHYWRGFDHSYDVKRAIGDFASWPPIVARGEELRREQRARRTGRATRR